MGRLGRAWTYLVLKDIHRPTCKEQEGSTASDNTCLAIRRARALDFPLQICQVKKAASPLSETTNRETMTALFHIHFESPPHCKARIT